MVPNGGEQCVRLVAVFFYSGVSLAASKNYESLALYLKRCYLLSILYSERSDQIDRVQGQSNVAVGLVDASLTNRQSGR